MCSSVVCGRAVYCGVFERGRGGSRRRDCHFADLPSPTMLEVLEHLLKGELTGELTGCSRMTVSSMAARGGSQW